MPLLDKQHYLELMGPNSEQIAPEPVAVEQVLQIAGDVWPSVGLEPRSLSGEDLVAVFRHSEKRFFHLRAFQNEQPDMHLIIVMEGTAAYGHILIDLVAEYHERG